MKYAVKTLLEEIARIEQNRNWTAQALTKETVKSIEVRLIKYIADYDAQIVELQNAIELLETQTALVQA